MHKAEKAEPLGQFHDRTGFRLGRRCPLPHLFVGASNPLGIFPADTEIYGYIKASVINPPGFLKDVQIHGFYFFTKGLNGFFR